MTKFVFCRVGWTTATCTSTMTKSYSATPAACWLAREVMKSFLYGYAGDGVSHVQAQTILRAAPRQFHGHIDHQFKNRNRWNWIPVARGRSHTDKKLEECTLTW